MAKSRQKFATVVVFIGFFSFVQPGDAVGFPIPVGGIQVTGTIVADTPTTLAFTLAGGAVNSSGAATPPNQTVPGLANWQVSGLNIGIFDLSPGGQPDLVIVTGQAVHTNNMPDDGMHAAAGAFGFTATFTGGPPPGIAFVPIGGGGQTDHSPHFDLYSLSADLARTPVNANDIASWNLEVRGEHVVPEPTTFLLWGTSMAGLGLARWRRRKQK